MVLLPWQAFGTWDRASKKIASIVCGLLQLAVLATCLSLFFKSQDTECSWCSVLNCVDIVADMCTGTDEYTDLRPT